MELPEELRSRLAGRTFEPIVGGESGALVWRCETDGSPPVYLKAAPLAAELKLDQEAARLRWMREHDLPVPAVREYCNIGDAEFLLAGEVAGVAASDPQWASNLPEVIAALADGLQSLHRISIIDCPFDQRLTREIEEARDKVARGRVREEDFDASRAGRRAVDLFAELTASAPSEEDLVFTHGDYCLPNIILHRNEASGQVEVAGFIDCGRAGVADRYQDLALAARSIAYNHGAEWVPTFFRRYGLSHPQHEKLHFYTLLDEFF